MEEEENNFAISDPKVIQVLEKLSISTIISFLQEIPHELALEKKIFSSFLRSNELQSILPLRCFVKKRE